MNEKFNVGDVVELKSGSPKMTIYRIKKQFDNGKPIEGAYECYCIWFLNGEPKDHTFDQLSLKHSE